jgi:class 3 adenylate cyclase/tetratricopeptide (TPR) repeat protein
MNFDETVAQIRAHLKTEGRVAYRMLKRRFELDDEDIDDIKAELIDAKRVAADEDGKVMVWLGSSSPVSAAADAIPANADRRLLTVMFCDVVDSTSLSEKFDPEELRDLIREYQQICASVIARFEGHIAQYLGDGLLVYFGYPTAQEDEAYQAVRSGLEILQSLRDSAALTERIGAPLRVRLGIHTGAVVIGEMGGEDRPERLALGDTPNIAARVQSTARPDELLISETTQRLVEGLFHIEPLGAQDLKGVSKSFDLYRVVDEQVTVSEFEVALSTGRLTRFVGQEEELELIRQDWMQALGGHGQAVLLSAEPGMGKSRLAQEFKQRVGDENVRQMTFRCSPYHRASPLYPVIQVLQRMFKLDANDSVEVKQSKVEHTLARYEFSVSDADALFCELLSLPGRGARTSGPRVTTEGRRRLFDVLIQWLIQESERAPVFMIWDDLHWADPSTVALIDEFLDHIPASATLALLIYRSSFRTPWRTRSFFRHLSLNRLADHHVDELIADVADDTPLPEAVAEEIKERADGIPLFVEELTRAVVEIGIAQYTDDANNASHPLIPLTLQDSLEARLDRCPTGKDVAQWGATIGREFSYALLRAAMTDDARVKTGIAELLEAELIYRSGSPTSPTFIFKHALLRDTAYESLLIRRRREYHARIAHTLDLDFPAIRETQPEVVAYHYGEGEQLDDAVRSWLRAGEYAHGRSADQEAMGHLQKGLEVLSRLPRTEQRAMIELDIQLLLGTLTISTLGNHAGDVESIYRRALTVCDEIGDGADKTPAYFGLRSFYLTNANLSAAHDVSLSLFKAASDSGREDALLEAHVALSTSYHFLGDLEQTTIHAREAASIYDPESHGRHALTYGIDPGITAHVRLAVASAWRGSVVEMERHFAAARAIADALGHAFSSSFFYTQSATTYHWLRDDTRARNDCEHALAIAEKHGFAFQIAAIRMLRGTLRVSDNDTEGGLREVESALSTINAVRSHLLYPYFVTLQAQAHASMDDPERGLAMLPDAFSVMEKTRAEYIKPQLYAVKGALLRHARLNEEAERAFESAIACARSSGSLAHELKSVLAVTELRQLGDDPHESFGALRALCEKIGSQPGYRDLDDALALIATGP